MKLVKCVYDEFYPFECEILEDLGDKLRLRRLLKWQKPFYQNEFILPKSLIDGVVYKYIDVEGVQTSLFDIDN